MSCACVILAIKLMIIKFDSQYPGDGMCFSEFSINKITPLVTDNVLLRERLYSIFDQPQSASSFWISGPGGSGKSTLIASYLRDRNIPCLWYQIDSFDGDLSNFFYYLSLAAAPLIDSDEQPLPLLTPEYLLNVDTYISHYFETLFQRLTSKCWIVLDNFQDAPDGSQLQQIVIRAIDMLPRQLTIAIASRNDPPPAMARLRANRALVNMDARQIAFTREESDQLIKLQGHQLTKQESEKIFQLSRGWVAGTILLLLHSKKHACFRPLLLDATPEIIFDYFASEILEKVDPTLRQFLLKTALLPHMTIEMANRLTGLQADKILNDLSRRNYFLEKRYLSTPSFQYHPLFHAYLLSKVKVAFNQEILKKLCASAAEILIKNDLIKEGVDLYIQAEEYESLVDIILGQAPVLTSQGRHQMLTSWINRLPAEYSEKNPWLLFWKGISLLAGNPVQGQKLCMESYKLFQRDNDFKGQIISWSMVVELYLLLRGNFSPLDHWIAEGERLSKLLPEQMDSSIFGRFASSILIALLLRKPDHPDINKWQERCEELLEECNDDQIVLSLAGNLSLSYHWFGQEAQAKGLLSTLKPLTDSTRVLPVIRIDSSAMISWLLLAIGDWQGCRQYVQEGLALSKKTGIHVYDFLLLCSEIYHQLMTGNLLLAERFLADIKNNRMAHATWDNGHYHFLIAWLTMLKGTLDRSNIHIERCLKVTINCGNPFTIAISILLKTQILLAGDEVSKAKNVLAELLENKVKHGSKHINFVTNLVRADCACCENREDKALKYLTAALALAKQNGIIIPSTFNHQRLSKLYAKALTTGIYTETIFKFIKLIRLPPPSSAMKYEKWPWPVQIYRLGTAEIKRYGDPLVFSAKIPKKPLELLDFLICSPIEKNSREKISDNLWPDADGDRAIQNFNITLHRLRKILGQDVAVVMENGRLSLNRELCWVDSWYFEEQVQLAKIIVDGKEEIIQKALSLYGGPFITTYGYNQEIKRYSEKLKNKWINLVDELAQKMADTNRHKQALKLLERSLTLDNTVESLYRLQMTILFGAESI